MRRFTRFLLVWPLLSACVARGEVTGYLAGWPKRGEVAARVADLERQALEARKPSGARV